MFGDSGALIGFFNLRSVQNSIDDQQWSNASVLKKIFHSVPRKLPIFLFLWLLVYFQIGR